MILEGEVKANWSGPQKALTEPVKQAIFRKSFMSPDAIDRKVEQKLSYHFSHRGHRIVGTYRTDGRFRREKVVPPPSGLISDRAKVARDSRIAFRYLMIRYPMKRG